MYVFLWALLFVLFVKCESQNSVTANTTDANKYDDFEENSPTLDEIRRLLKGNQVIDPNKVPNKYKSMFDQYLTSVEITVEARARQPKTIQRSYDIIKVMSRTFEAMLSSKEISEDFAKLFNWEYLHKNILNTKNKL